MLTECQIVFEPVTEEQYIEVRVIPSRDPYS